MREPRVVSIDASPRARAQRRLRDLAATLRTPAPSPPAGGRAWLNGSELGGTAPRNEHLQRAHD